MKFILLFFGLLTFNSSSDIKCQGDLLSIENTVKEFVLNADNQDAAKMDNVLHAEFRAIVNRLFGSKEVSIMTKTIYLDLLKEGKIGGDKRSVEIHSIGIDKNNATTRATFTGTELIFTTFIQLVKEESGQWKVISDMPVISKKK